MVGLRGAELAEVFPLADPFRSMGVTKVVGPETRGMVLGTLVAAELSAGLVCARRAEHNHPGADVAVTSEPSRTGQTEAAYLGASVIVGKATRAVAEESSAQTLVPFDSIGNI